MLNLYLFYPTGFPKGNSVVRQRCYKRNGLNTKQLREVSIKRIKHTSEINTIVVPVIIIPLFSRLEHGTTYTIVVTHPMDLGGKVRKVNIIL